MNRGGAGGTTKIKTRFTQSQTNKTTGKLFSINRSCDQGVEGTRRLLEERRGRTKATARQQRGNERPPSGQKMDDIILQIHLGNRNRSRPRAARPPTRTTEGVKWEWRTSEVQHTKCAWWRLCVPRHRKLNIEKLPCTCMGNNACCRTVHGRTAKHVAGPYMALLN